jgi:hypothetical protein
MLGIPLKMESNPLEQNVEHISNIVAEAGSIAHFSDLPPCSESIAFSLEVLSYLPSPSYIIAADVGLNLYYAVCSIGTKISLEHGFCSFSAGMFACYAAFLTSLSIPLYTYCSLSQIYLLSLISIFRTPTCIRLCSSIAGVCTKISSSNHGPSQPSFQCLFCSLAGANNESCP